MVNVPMLHGNTSRSFLRCFPSKNESEPVPNELSTLIFYLQTRPGKIPKLVAMIEEKTAHAARRNRPNVMLVCCLIMREIVQQLSAHTSLFAKGTVDVINALLTSPNDAVFQQTCLLFADYNAVHHGLLFMGYPGFAQHFLDVVRKFTSVARAPTNTNSNAAKSNSKQTQALTSLASLGHSPAAQTVCGRQALTLALEGILSQIRSTDKLCSEVAMSALRAYIDTPSLAQTSTVMDTVIAFLGPHDESQLLLLLQSQVQPANRFGLCVCLVQSLSESSEQEIMARSHMLDTLLKNPDSKLGLSAVDILRVLLEVQHAHIDNNDVILQLRSNIGSLAATAIYPGQSGDLTGEILLSLKRYKAKIANSKENTNASANFECDLLNVLEVMKSSTPGDRKLPAAVWQDTFFLASYSDPRVASTYATAFTKFMSQGKAGHSISVQRGIALAKGLCAQLPSSEGAETQSAESYCALFSCLVALARTMGTDSLHILSVLVETLDKGSRSRTVLLAVCKRVLALGQEDGSVISVHWPEFQSQPSQTVNEIEDQFENQLENQTESEIENQIELELKTICISVPYKTKEVPQVDSWGVDMGTLEEDTSFADSGRGNTFKRPSTSHKLTNLSPPLVKDLVRRQTDTLSQYSARSARSSRHSMQSMRSVQSVQSVHSRPSSVTPYNLQESRRQLLSMVQDVSLESNSKGTLTVH